MTKSDRHRRDVHEIIDRILESEGGYVDHPHDLGGPTNFGTTEATARKAGFTGNMRELTQERAEEIYLQVYYTEPGFDVIAEMSHPIACELTDTGVNMGPGVAVVFLQRCLNVFNHMGQIYPDLLIDGQIGPKTAEALQAFLEHRGGEGEIVMLTALNCLQGARYIELSEKREKNESFTYGWLR